MSRLLLIWLFSVLCFADILLYIVIAISSEDESIKNNDETETQSFRREQKRPHIIIILADDMGWNDVSFHGSDQIPTPNIDALAYNGVILNNHYVSALCTPSRAALMTGKDPIHLGMQHNVLLASEPRGLPLTEKLLPQYLKEVNYKTHIVGKWNLGCYKHEYTPMYRGFDTHFGYWNGLQDYYNHTYVEPAVISSGPPKQGFDMRRNLSVAWDTIGKYSTDLYTEEAVRLINTHNTNDPMFLYLAHLAPHSANEYDQLQAPTEEIAKFSYITDPQRRIYAAMVSKLDQSVGEVVEALKNRSMLENSIVLFMSDNGAATEDILANRGSNYPFRGIKGSPWEGAVRGVTAIWSSLIKKRERVSNQLMFIADWLPTLLSAAGISKENIPKVDGYDMWSALSNGINQRNRNEVIINIDDIIGYEAIRRGNFKYVNGEIEMRYNWVGDSGHSINEKRSLYNPENVLHSKAGIAIAQVQMAKRILNQKRNAGEVIAETFRENKLTSQKILQLRRQAQVHCNVREEEKISCNPSISPCLFDIKNDPCEMINIIKQQPVIAEDLKYALAKHRLEMVPPSNKELDPQANPIYWNNTWVCWKDPPLKLMLMMSSKVDDVYKQSTYSYNTYLGTSFVIPIILFALSIISGIILFNLYCSKKSLYNSKQFPIEDNCIDNPNNVQREEYPILERMQHFRRLSSIRTIEDAYGSMI